MSQSFNRRIRLLVEVTNHPDEIALARELFAAKGWPVRDPRNDEAIPLGLHRVGLVVEVRLRGARSRARAAAVQLVEGSASRVRLGLWVRHSLLIEPVRERRTEYKVRLLPPTDGRLLARWALRIARHLDGSHDRRAISRPGAPDHAGAVDELTAYDFGDGAYDPATEAVHGPPDMPTGSAGQRARHTPGSRSVADGFLADGLSLVLYLGGVLICLTCGGIIQELSSPWRWVAVLSAPMLTWLFGRPFEILYWRRRYQLAAGLGLSFAFLAFGIMLVGMLPANTGNPLLASLLLALGAALVVGVLLGVWFALVPSWISRNANWLIPGLVAPMYFLLPWFGTFLYTVYLTYGFGIPMDAVPIARYSLAFAALKPVGVAAGFALFFVAVAGWARHLHYGRLPGRFPSFVLPAVALLYVATALVIGVATAGASMERSAAAAQSGRSPTGYYGLQGHLMCVTPLSKDIAVYNGPLPTGHAVLTFGSTDDQIWLWGPHPASRGKERWEAMSVPLDAVALTPPGRAGARCAH